MQKFRVIDLFCGAGGFSRGFKDVGFEIVLGIDNFSPAALTFSKNFPEAKVIVEDIKNIRGEDLESLVGTPDVIIGGPPCEPYTGANPRRMKDPLDRLYVDPVGRLVLHYIRLVGDLQPRFFVMENVPGIVENGLREAIQNELARVGYEKVYFNKLYAEDYCTPSHRLRVFISNIKLKPKKCKRRIPVIEAIGDLPEPGSAHIPNHEPVPLPRRKLKKISKLKWGEALIKYRGAKRLHGNFIRLHPYRIAPTVMGSSRFVHPFEDRLLTVREHARLMGFPDDHVFLGGRDVQFNEVGEAVPVPLARSIAREILRNLES